MPSAEDETIAVTATAYANSFRPNSPPGILAEEPDCSWSVVKAARKQRATMSRNSDPVAFLRQLSVSIGEINQPISAIVMNAEAALRLLLTQPQDTDEVRRVLACIVKDGMRTGDIVNRTSALIKNVPPADTDNAS
jgi:C4-dicarboxylate-specific signal transduction histidine kinase